MAALISVSTTRPRSPTWRANPAARSPVPPATSRALPRSEIGEREGEPLPQPMDPARHEVVHQVVAAGDRIEHAPHAAGFITPRYALKAEVCGALVGHLFCGPRLPPF